MRLNARLVAVFLLLALASVAGREGYARTCYPPEQASEHAEKDICVTAHVYNLLEGADGTRMLDVCKPGASSPEDGCHFSIVSLSMDRPDVGDLASVRDHDIQLRGTVHVLHGQATMILSHARQFRDGPEKFRPNPALLGAFDASSGEMAFRDPALTGHKKSGGSAFKSAKR